jgi:hypothetical protein
MADQIVRINRNGGVPEIELKFGFAQFAKFRILLWDITGQNPTEIAHGVNIDAIPDKFPIGTAAADLDGRFITWQVVIATPTGGAGQQYSQSAAVTQDGSNCPDGPFTQSGQLDNTITTFDQAKFEVVD